MNNKDNSSSKISITSSSSVKRATGLVMLQLGYLILESRGNIKISSRYSSILSIYIPLINTFFFYTCYFIPRIKMTIIINELI